MKKLFNKLRIFLIGPRLIHAEYHDRIMFLIYENSKFEKFEGSDWNWYKIPYMKKVKSFKKVNKLHALHQYMKDFGPNWPHPKENIFKNLMKK